MKKITITASHQPDINSPMSTKARVEFRLDDGSIQLWTNFYRFSSKIAMSDLKNDLHALVDMFCDNTLEEYLQDTH